MTRAIGKTLTDLNAMDAAQIRMCEVIYAKAFYQSLYDDALDRVGADLGKTLDTIRLIFPTSSPQELTDAIRQFLRDRDKPGDVPLTSPPGSPW